MNSDASEASTPRVAWAVLLVAMTLLAFELVVTRLFSVILWNHFAFLAISVALFGLGVAGVLVYALPERFSRERASSQLRACALLLPGALWFAVTVLCALPIRMDFKREMFAFLAAVFLTTAVPFVVGGLAIALALTHWTRSVNRIYGFDLVGSALGCLLVIGLLDRLDGPSAALALAILPALAAMVLRRSWFAAMVLLVAVAGTFLNAHGQLVRVRIARNNVQGPLLYERWNAFSRVTVFPSENWRGWWVSPASSDPPVATLGVQIDADAFTPLINYDGDLDAVRVLLSDVTSVAYHILPGADSALVIGAGGGKDVLAALVAGVRHVRAVELNPIIARDIVSDRFRAFTGDLYRHPRVELVVGEGRTVLRHDPARYDIIQLSMVDTSAASAAGAYALTENSLYTLEAAREFLGHLHPNGIVTTTWVNFFNLEGGNRLVALYAEALRREGHRHPERHLAVIGAPGRLLTVLARPTAFTASEVDALRALCDRLGFVPLHLAGLTGEPIPDASSLRSDADVIRRLATGSDLDRFYDGHPLDLRPVTDDRPFFFYQQRFRDAWPALWRWNVGSLYGNGLFILIKLLLISAVAVLVFMLLPLLLFGRARRVPFTDHRAGAVYFACLGTGFIVLEIALVQRFGYYLGHPLLGLGVSLTSLLFFTGIGSAVSGRWPESALAVRTSTALGLVVVVGLLLFALLPALTAWTIASPLGVRVTVAVAVLAPLGLLLGIPFPAGLRLLTSGASARASARAALVPWMWAINSGATVFGSTLATMLVIHLGFGRTQLIGTMTYALALLAFRSLNGSLRSVGE